MYAPGGLTGRGPENVEWSPDGTKLSFVQRRTRRKHGETLVLWTRHGREEDPGCAAKLASLAPDATKVKDERERERLTRYSRRSLLVGARFEHLIFDSQGTASGFLISRQNGGAVHFSN